MPQLEFTTAGTAEVERAYDRMRAKQREQIESTKESAAEMRKWDRIVNDSLKRSETAQQRYNRLVAEMSEAFKKTGRSTQEYAQAVGALDREFANLDGRFKSFRDSADETFGEAAMSQITEYAMNFASITAVIGVARAAFQEYQREVERAAEFAAGGKGGVGMLRQLTKNQAEFDILLNQAKSLAATGAVENLDQGAQAVFGLASAGLGSDADFALLQALGSKGIIADLPNFARAVKTQISAMGKDEVGDLQQIVTKAFIASGFSPATVEDLLISASKSGASARSLGISDEENLAAISLLATNRGTASEGATAVASFLNALDRVEGTTTETRTGIHSNAFKGKSISQIVAMLNARQMNSPELIKFFGDKEAVVGFRVLSENLEEFGAISRAIDQGQFDMSQIGDRLALKDPATDAARQMQAVENQNAIRAEIEAAYETLQDSVLSRHKSKILQDRGILFGGLGAFGITMSDWMSTGRSFFNRSDESLARSGIELTDEDRDILRSIRQKEDTLMRQQTDVLEGMLEENRKTNDILRGLDGGLTGGSE